MAAELLAGLKVIDLGHYIAGPFCAKLLGLLGAEVIKVEKPGEGDPSRRLGPFPGDVPHLERSGTFLYLNTNKKGLTLNLKNAAGRRLFLQLVKDADVLVENFAPRVMPSLSLDYAHLETINPRLVMTSISNFGQTGPYQDWKADEMVILGLSSLLDRLGLPDREPITFGSPVGQYFGGVSAFAGTMMALHYARQTGMGQQVDVSLSEAFAGIHPEALVRYVYTGQILKRERIPMVMPCRDGMVMMSGQPYQWPRLCEAIGMPELAKDPRFRTLNDRKQRALELEAIILPFTLAHGMEEVYHQGQAARAPFSYFARPSDLVQSPQYKERGFFVEVDHPAVGRQTYPGTPFQIEGVGSETFSWGHTRAPLLGEHNEEIYGGQLGYSRPDLVRLRQMGAI